MNECESKKLNCWLMEICILLAEGDCVNGDNYEVSLVVRVDMAVDGG